MRWQVHELDNIKTRIGEFHVPKIHGLIYNARLMCELTWVLLYAMHVQTAYDCTWASYTIVASAMLAWYGRLPYTWVRAAAPYGIRRPTAWAGVGAQSCESAAGECQGREVSAWVNGLMELLT